MFILISVILVTLFVVLVKLHYSKWQRLGISYDKPRIPFGSLLKVCLGQRPIGLVLTDIYDRFEDKIVGIYMLTQPAILLRSPELIHRIYTSDFASFHGRGMFVDEENDPMTANLVSLDGQKWRSLRSRLSPAFSGAQLKVMFETIDKVGDHFIEYLMEQTKDGQFHNVEFKNVTTS